MGGAMVCRVMLSDLAIGLSPDDLRGHVPNTHRQRDIERIKQG